MTRFPIYNEHGFIGFASGIRPFSSESGPAFMIDDFEMASEQEEIHVKAPTNKTLQFPPREIEPEPEREIIRQRLPNFDKKTETLSWKDENGELLAKTVDGKPMRFTAFRCPTCGQSEVMSVNGDVVFRELDGDRSISRSRKGLSISGFRYEDHKDDIAAETVQLEGTTEIDGFCPKCLNTTSLFKWGMAWSAPMEFFVFDHPCAKCGGETVVIIKDGVEHRCCENTECKYDQTIGRYES